MTIERVTYLYCDGNEQECPLAGGPYRVAPVPGESAKIQRQDAALYDGWERIKGKDYCAECAKEAK